jgi:hypothetical protein
VKIVLVVSWHDTPHVVAVLLHGDGLHGVRLRAKEPGGAPALEGVQLRADMVRQLVCLRTRVGAIELG